MPEYNRGYSERIQPPTFRLTNDLEYYFGTGQIQRGNDIVGGILPRNRPIFELLINFPNHAFSVRELAEAGGQKLLDPDLPLPRAHKNDYQRVLVAIKRIKTSLKKLKADQIEKVGMMHYAWISEIIQS